MNILVITNFFLRFVVSEIPRVSVFGHSPYSVTFSYTRVSLENLINYKMIKIKIGLLIINYILI